MEVNKFLGKDGDGGFYKGIWEKEVARRFYKVLEEKEV